MSSGAPPGRSLSGSVKRGVVLSTLSFGLSKGATLASTLVLTRLLTPSQFGVVAGVLVLLSLIELTSDLGMKATVIYEQERGASSRVHTAFTINVLLSIVLAGAGLAVSPWVAGFFHASHHSGLFRLAFVDVLITGLGSIPDALLLRDLRFRERIVSEISNAAVRAVVSVALAASGLGAASLVWGVLAGTTAWTAVLWALTRFRPRFSLKRSVVGSMLGYSLAASAHTLLSQMYAAADPAAVGRILGQGALGLYTVAFRVPVLVLENISYQISLVAFPALARKRTQDRHGVGEATQRLVRYQSFYALPVAALMAALAHPIVVVVFSSRWKGAAGVFAGVSVYSGLSAATFALGDGFKAIGRQRVMVFMSALQLPLMIVSVILAAPFGITAVAWIRAAGELAWSVAMVSIATRVMSISARASLQALRPGVVAAVGALPGALAIRYLTELPALAQVVAGTLAGGLSAMVALAALAPHTRARTLGGAGELRARLRRRREGGLD